MSRGDRRIDVVKESNIIGRQTLLINKASSVSRVVRLSASRHATSRLRTLLVWRRNETLSWQLGIESRSTSPRRIEIKGTTVVTGLLLSHALSTDVASASQWSSSVSGIKFMPFVHFDASPSSICG